MDSRITGSCCFYCNTRTNNVDVEERENFTKDRQRRGRKKRGKINLQKKEDVGRTVDETHNLTRYL